MARSSCATAEWNAVAEDAVVFGLDRSARETGAWSSACPRTRMARWPIKRRSQRRVKTRMQAIAWVMPTSPSQPGMVLGAAAWAWHDYAWGLSRFNCGRRASGRYISRRHSTRIVAKGGGKVAR